MFWRKKKQDNGGSRIILGMVMLQDGNSFQPEVFHKDYTANYKKPIREQNGDSTAFVFEIDDERILIGHMPVAIPRGDIEGTAEYAYNWETAIEDLKNHKSHLIVSVRSGGSDQIKRFKIFTEIICSLLRTTNSVGVYIGNQTLLIARDSYLTEASLMTDDYFPLNLWIYFGYRVTDNGNSGYTYGLKEFGKIEMEIIESSRSIGEISTFLFNIVHYVLNFDVTFKDGQTCGMSADERIAITFSKGKLVEGDTLKVAY